MYCHILVNIVTKGVNRDVCVIENVCIRRIRIRIYLLAGRNLLWDILRLPSSRRAALGLYVILTL